MNTSGLLQSIPKIEFYFLKEPDDLLVNTDIPASTIASALCSIFFMLPTLKQVKGSIV